MRPQFGDIVGSENTMLVLDDMVAMFMVMIVKDGVCGVVTVKSIAETNLLGRQTIPSVLFHHLGPCMRDIRRFLTAPVQRRFTARREDQSLAMVGIPSSVNVLEIEESLPFTCTVDVSHIITCNPRLFERLKPHLKGSAFTLTEDLYFELKLAL